MKRLIILLSILTGVISVYGQQSPLYTQYMHNPFILNPAVAGTYNFFQARTMHRFQWVGITDAPVTNSISLFGPLSSKNKDMGYGGTVYNDVTGPTSKLGLSGAFAYNMKVNDITRISFGASLGLLQYKVDGTKITTEVDDPYLTKNVMTKYMPDATIGVYLYSTQFHVGLSADKLFNNTLDFNNNQPKGVSKLTTHFYLNGSYTYLIDKKWSVESSMLLKKVVAAPLQLDINVRGIYKKNYWGGLSFRSYDAISIMAAYLFNKKIYVGYSYDWTFSQLRKYSSGSHEIMLGYKFNALK